MMEGARGQELQQLSGLSKTDYESKRTKIRRRIEKLRRVRGLPASGNAALRRRTADPAPGVGAAALRGRPGT